jgi:TPR repeat protein
MEAVLLMIKLIRSAVLALLLIPTMATSQDFDKGVAAYNAGDYATALLEWTPLAVQGVANAQYNLALMYSNGVGVPQYDALAAKWYRLAAEQGYASAQFNLGLMYENGKGVPQDYTEAVKWYRLAAGRGVAKAQLNLALIYDNGVGVPQNYTEAVKWYRLAADQGDASAQFNLALMYDNGRGVPQDFVAAHMWFNVSSANGNEKAGSRRDIVAGRMLPADVSMAQQRARVCMKSNYQDCD